MIVESVDAIARENASKTEPAGRYQASLRHFLNQLTTSEVKALHLIAQSCRADNWLEGPDSIEPLYYNLSHTKPGMDKQTYIDFLVSLIDFLPEYIARYSKTCSEWNLDPFDKLASLVEEDKAHSHSSI